MLAGLVDLNDAGFPAILFSQGVGWTVSNARSVTMKVLKYLLLFLDTIRYYYAVSGYLRHHAYA